MNQKRNSKDNIEENVEEIEDNNPRSFVFSKGKVGTTVKALVNNFKQTMKPYTASNLKVKKSNKMKDLLNVCGPYGITHFAIFTVTEQSPVLKILKTPQGPTLYFRIKDYSLSSDIINLQKRSVAGTANYQFPPVVVMSGFRKTSELIDSDILTLLKTSLRNMFPSFDPEKKSIAQCKRVVLFKRNKETETIEFRHYSIKMKNAGISDSIRQLHERKNVSAHDFTTIEDFINSKDSAGIDEEVLVNEDDAELERHSFPIGKGSQQMKVSVKELGPRLTLEPFKIEAGFLGGELLWSNDLEKKDDETKVEEKEEQKEEEEEKEVRKEKKEKKEKVKHRNARYGNAKNKKREPKF
eukprot:TRINITY_DN7040_c0_g1_i1.p1 TRINITY_DN7040_c0_g1~~TRINITY_DN7040_c0_g1_i1.p1  ORF type:complete len:364 (+),score=111.10 TRINITY_DN7040_c0_g1_i1:34-1092(+)